MPHLRSLRAGLAALVAVAGVALCAPGSPLASATPVPLVATGAGDSTTTTTEELAAYRRAQLGKQSSAIDVHNATLRALYAQKVAELGYDPVITEPREIARQIMQNKYGWGAAEYRCYDAIIMRESRWNPLADNPYSSAYGIPQALPGHRMAAFGADWRTNPATQIRWGLDYVHDRYGTPCSAWGFKRSHGWY